MADNNVVRCHFCGSENVELTNYNYDYAVREFECYDCGECFNDNVLTYCDECNEQILQNEAYFDDDNCLVLCEECYRNSKGKRG